MASDDIRTAALDLANDVRTTIDNLGWLDQSGEDALAEVVRATMELGRHIVRLTELVARQEESHRGQ